MLLKKIITIICLASFFFLGGEVQSWASDEQIKLTVQIPFSMKGKAGVALPGSKVKGYFLVENQAEQPTDVKIKVTLPEGFLPQQNSTNWHSEKQGDKYILTAQAHLATQLDNWFDLLSFQVDKNLTAGSYPVEVSTEIKGKIIKRKYPVMVSSDKQLANWVKLEELILPVDEDGKNNNKYQENTLILRESSTEFYRSVFRGTGAVDSIEQEKSPLTYLGVVLRNQTAHPVTVLLSTQLLDKKDKKPLAAFHLPDDEGLVQKKGEITLLAELKGGERKIIPLPIYLEEGKVKGGEYQLHTSVKMMGSNMLLAEGKKDINLLTRNFAPLIVTVVALLLCFSAIAFFACKQKKILAGFQTKELILIALFGTASFLSVNIPGTILNDLAHVFLGPFSFLITGIFNGIVLYMLLISLLILLPRPGVIWLVSLVRVMLNGIALGHFTPLSFLFYLSAAIFLEIALYWVGLTRPSPLQRNLLADHWTKKDIYLLALACGLADMLASYVNFQGIIFLYRLYYASWYIGFYLIVNGIFYSMIGVWLGVILGRKLQKVSTD